MKKVASNNVSEAPLARRSFRTTAIFAALIGVFGISGAQADGWDDESLPSKTDPSAYTDQPTTEADLATSPEFNEGALALPNGQFGDKKTPRQENVLPPALQTSYNYPTNGKPSRLFGAQPFTQQMLLFEEFGVEKLDPSKNPSTAFPPPKLGPGPEQDPNNVARSAPAGADLSAFLRQKDFAPFPFPQQSANTDATNPWQSEIAAFLHPNDLSMTRSPAEGRPPGKGWSHQRWNEFYPQVFFQTAQAGARVNGGSRDKRQLHDYSKGEFGDGGLYHTVFQYKYDPNKVDPNDPPISPDCAKDMGPLVATTNGIPVKFHPCMPVQHHESLWTFDGTVPAKLLMARYGQPILMRHFNGLPIDPVANRGFGLHTISTHEHNGHNPAESDGFANAFFFPGQFYDYRWPLQLAGYDSINTSATDPRAAFPCADGEELWTNDATPSKKSCQNGTIKIRGDWRETMSTHWFHDHMVDFTAQNVYKGNAAMMNYYSAVDRGREEGKEGKCHYQNAANPNLCLPSGTALPWGNRDYDINLVIGDKAWDKDGQLWFNPFNMDGFIGDRLLTNWQYNPYMDVRQRRYRFRILNGSVSRFLAIAVVQEVKGTKGEFQGPPGSGVSYNRVPFHMVANDGNILEHAVPFDGTMDLDGNGNKDEHKGLLPTQAIAERYDIVIDFAKNGINPGDKIYFVNVKEHDTGLGSKRNVPLADVLSEKYKAVVLMKNGQPEKWDKGDPVVGKFLELRVSSVKPKEADLSMNPADYVPGKKKMIPLWFNRDKPAPEHIQAMNNAPHREFIFGRSDNTDEVPWTVKSDGSIGMGANPRRISAAPQLASGPTAAGTVGEGTLEIWKIINGGNGWSHPVHVHFEEGVILRRGDKAPPEWEKWARKDVYRVGTEPDSLSSVEIAVRFREFAGTYVEHCHNTQHEDNSMLLRWDLEHPHQWQIMPTPLPTWEGVTYAPSAVLPTFRTGDGTTGPSFKF